jgi:hypothetical protein
MAPKPAELAGKHSEITSSTAEKFASTSLLGRIKYYFTFGGAGGT